MNIEYLLKKHSFNHVGSTIERLLPYYQCGRQSLLSNKQREILWRDIRHYIKGVETKKFKRRQQQGTLVIDTDIQELRTNRQLIIYENCEYFEWPKYTPNYILQDYQLGFYRYEAMLTLTALGIAIPGEYPMKKANHWLSTSFVDYMKFRRSNFQYYEDYYETTKNEILSDSRLQRIIVRFRILEHLIYASGGLKDNRVAFFRGNHDYDWLHDNHLELLIQGSVFGEEGLYYGSVESINQHFIR